MSANKSRSFLSFKEYVKDRYGKKEKILTFTLLFLVTFIVLFQVFYQTSTSFYRDGEKEAVKLAKNQGGIVKVEDFYYTNLQKTYFTVKGQDSKNKVLYIMIPQDGEEMLILKESDGISSNEALEIGGKKNDVKQINKIGLGKYKNEVVWELTGLNNENKTVYYYLNFKTGSLVKEIEI